MRSFLAEAVRLQSTERQFDCFKPGTGLIPASFKAHQDGDPECLIPDLGEHAIARVAPVDSGFWWLPAPCDRNRRRGRVEVLADGGRGR